MAGDGTGWAFRCLPSQTTLGFRDVQIREVTGMDKNVRTAERCIFCARESGVLESFFREICKYRQKRELPGSSQARPFPVCPRIQGEGTPGVQRGQQSFLMRFGGQIAQIEALKQLDYRESEEDKEKEKQEHPALDVLTHL